VHFLAAGTGFSFADPYALALLFVGFAVFAAIGALSHQHERAFSASLIYLGLGLGAAVVLGLAGVSWIQPIEDSDVLEHVTEFALVIALFSTGLKLDRSLDPRGWGSVLRLLGGTMLLSIAAVALFAWGVMGLSVGVAIVLGAALAPTDPVLAGDIGVGPPGEEDEREPHFSITAEAGLNDGLAFPFLLLGLFLVEREGGGWVGEWLAADVVYAVVAGVAIGALSGYGIAALAVRLRDRKLLLHDLDGWLGIAAVLVVYGLAETAGAYGFLAAFVGGLAFRRYERDHEVNEGVHRGSETVEKFGELAVLLLLGSLVTLEGLGRPGWSGWLLVVLVIVVIRPLTVFVSFVGSRLPSREQAFLAWFGVRGVGSLYYATFAIGAGVLARSEQEILFWTVAVAVLVSIAVHGTTGTPLSRRLLEPVPRSGEGSGVAADLEVGDRDAQHADPDEAGEPHDAEAAVERVATAEAPQGQRREGASRQPAEVAADGDVGYGEREHEVDHDDAERASPEHVVALTLEDESGSEQTEDRP